MQVKPTKAFRAAAMERERSSVQTDLDAKVKHAVRAAVNQRQAFADDGSREMLYPTSYGHTTGQPQ